MILEQLILRNYCLYSGQQTFDLTPVSQGGRHRPIVLFGGMNGGGKTTLLDAIQLSLYGARARCSNRADLSYEEFLRASIHRGAEPGERAGVTLKFHYAVDGKEYLYDVQRTWSDEEGRVREELRVYRDNVLDGWLTDNWAQLVEELFPLEIAQLFFFDAEKIRLLAEDASSSRALEAAIKALLGLDVVERLISDSSVLQTRLAKRVGTSEDQNNATILEERVAQFQAKLQQITTERATLENTRLRAVEELRVIEAKFATSGGHYWETRESRSKRLEKLNQEARECRANLVEFASGDLPLALVSDLLAVIQVQADKETRAAESDVIGRSLHARDERLLTFLREANASATLINRVRIYLAADRDNQQPTSMILRRLNLSDGAITHLRDLRGRGASALLSQVSEILSRLKRMEFEREDLERADAATPDESGLGTIVEEMKAATQRLALLEDQAMRLDKAIAVVRADFQAAERELAKLIQSKVEANFDSEDTRRMLHLASRTRDTMQEFLKRVTIQKIDRLSELITESFLYLLRKQSFIQRIAIDPLTFAITLFDSATQSVPKERLSEGEKQIFAISVLWGLARAAARPLPAVIDTPMARLDATHRQHLVERYFPHASHQVVIFSTDTEVDLENYRLLQPFIARAYHLNYDEKRKMTVGERGYFWAEEQPGAQGGQE